MSEFAKNLRKFRKQKGYSQEKLAKALHYGYTAITNYEGGRNEPSYDDLMALSRELDTSPNDLLGFAFEDKYADFLEAYKKLSPEHQKIISDMINALQPWLNSDKELITYQLLADGIRGAYGQIPSDFQKEVRRDSLYPLSKYIFSEIV